MSTPLVVSVTDELVAELEALANECGQHGANWYEPRHMAAFPEYPCDQDFVVAASPATILAMLAERAEFRRLLLEQEQIMQSLRDSELALIGEREELLRDAERYRLFAGTVVADCNSLPMTTQQATLFGCMNEATSVTMDELAAMFDTAMQSEDKL